MSQFHIFSQAVHAQFVAMQAGLLFTVNITGDDLYTEYLSAFPKGTNEIFRERTEHDCSCCKNFIRNIGNVVGIDQKTGALITVWDRIEGLPRPYDEVSAIMGSIVRSHIVDSLFQCDMPNYGAESTVELRDGVTHRWNHFFSGPIAKQHYDKNQAGTRRGKFNTDRGVFKRALDEISPDAVAAVLDLMADNNLYKGTEYQPAVAGFKALQDQYHASLKRKGLEFDNHTWLNANQHGALIRNTAIGTLLQDLSEGKPLEAAVKSYEDKVSGTNYKRPKALVTPAMVNAAMATIKELGVEPSLERRFAKASDVNVNDILFVDGSLRSQMKGGLGDLLMAHAKGPRMHAAPANAEEVSIHTFISKILPQATGLELMVENRHQGNFVSLTAPAHADVEPIFKWPNNFAWSYDGNIADSELRRNVEKLGGRVDGVLRFTHTWNYDARNASLMDLHVFMPGSSRHEDGQHDRYPTGQRVGWNHRNDGPSGGVQDVDYTEAAPEGCVPVENITFPDMARLKEGQYVFKIHNWQHRNPTKGGFRAEIEFGGQIFQYDHPEPLSHKEWVTVAVATLKDGVFTIEHKLPTSSTSKDKWGIKTEQFTRVDTMMLSPNHWGDAGVGHKHFIFVLDGCKNPAPTRGIYNEFLKPELEKHRKVFELLGSKTMCPVVEGEAQLSGVGFSATKKDMVTVRVNGGRLYNIAF